MADANIPLRPMPPDWRDAFTALPLERAPTDAWARLAAALPATPRAAKAPPRRRPAWRVLAAAASIAAAVPLAWWLTTRDALVEPHDPPLPLVSTRQPAAGPARPADLVREPTRSSSSHIDVATARPEIARASDRAEPPRPTRRLPVSPVASTKVPLANAAAASVVPAVASVATNAPSAEPSRLDTLRQESARLEALVAYARDDRMTSATAAVMSASLDDRIRLIDAALMQPDLGDDARSSLWDQRVGALQELAALEGTQRWMAAHGTSMDAVARVD